LAVLVLELLLPQPAIAPAAKAIAATSPIVLAESFILLAPLIELIRCQ
jgi:hypothetical protein